jgi:hypothetical protein
MIHDNAIPIKSEQLLQQLRGLKFIVDGSRDVLNKNLTSKEFLAFKIDIANNLIEELQLWENLGNASKCNSVFDDARFFVEQAWGLMNRMLDEQCEEAWLEFQRELRFANHACLNHKYVLSCNNKDCPISVAG